MIFGNKLSHSRAPGVEVFEQVMQAIAEDDSYLLDSLNKFLL